MQIIEQYLLAAYNLGIMPFVIGLMAAVFIIIISLVMKPGKQINNIYVKINNRLIRKQEKKHFDYDKLHKKLSQSGMLFKHPWLEKPAAYYGIKICFALLLGVIGGMFYLILIPLGFVVGYLLFDAYMYFSNNSDNKKMQKDIELIYNLLSIQIRSGVYLPDALCECANIIDPADTRLKTSLTKLSGNLIIGTPVKEAIKKFNDDFDNQHIDSLCVIIAQASESGLAEDLLADISKQVKVFSSLQMEKKKQEMDISMTIVILGLFVDIMVVIMSLAIGTIMTDLTNF